MVLRKLRGKRKEEVTIEERGRRGECLSEFKEGEEQS